MASQQLLLRAWAPGAIMRPDVTTFPLLSFPYLPLPQRQRKPTSLLILRAKTKTEEMGIPKPENQKNPNKESSKIEEEEEEVEEELPWVQEKAMDLVEFTGTVTQAIPGPRVGQSSLPWILAIPLAYVGISFVLAVVKTVKKFNSPREKRKTLVNKNAMLCKSIDELFQTGRDAVQLSTLKGLMQKTGFEMEEILRKYIRYALNEKPFNPDMIVDLLHLRKASMLEDEQIAEVLNEISRRIVKEKGPVVMDISGFTEKGFQRKVAVQALFGKILYLSELPEFCSRDSLIIKEIFGVTDQDVDTLRIHTLAEAGDVDSLEKMVDSSDSEETK
ncbi:ribosomal RNA small subunit methyltransferase J [Tasmannia lanceolata]|uniref:ribosomal RNA small subunit methyltransferase J n=1 Tax=Tasmannia lanceolata TaxID=3420 RepID=UPI004063BB2E